MPLTPSIGIFGGTFDPVHTAHLAVADEVRRRLAIEDFRLVPAGDPPHRARTGADARHRLAMLELAVADWPGLLIDDRELHRAGPSYMVDTLSSLRAEHPDAPLLLVVGQDSANSLDQWHRWRELLDLAHLVIMSRPGRPAAYGRELGRELQARAATDPAALRDRTAGRVLALQVDAHRVSATRVRRQLASGEPTLDLLPPRVADYIQHHGLYGAADVD